MLAPEGAVPVLTGGCFCGRLNFGIFNLDGIALSAYCHCTICQRLMGCPFVHTIHLKEKAFAWSYAREQPIEETFDFYEVQNKHKRRFRCKECGVQVASFNTVTSEYSVWGACLERGPDGEILNWEKVKPTAHQFYGTRMLDVNDELGKWEGYEGKSAKLG